MLMQNLRNDGSVIAWGDLKRGRELELSDIDLKLDVKHVFSSRFNF